MQFRRIHLIHFAFNKSLTSLFLSNLLRQFGFAMLGVFIPIFLIEKPYFDLGDVALFYLTASIIYILTIIPAVKLTKVFGSKKQMVLSALILIVLAAMFYTIDAFRWPVYLMGLMLGLSYTFYWTAFLINFAKDTDKEHRAEEVGIMRTMVIALSIIGPLLGGLIITYLGFPVLFILTAAIFLASAYPLYKAPRFFEPGEYSLRKVFSLNYNKTWPGFFAMGGEYHADMAVWPIFIFAVLSEYVLLGTIFTAGMLIALIFTYVLSEYADHLKKISLLRLGALLSALNWVGKVFAAGFLDIFGLHSAGKAFSTASGIPLEAVGFDRAQENVTEYVLVREIAIHTGAALFFIAIFLAFPIWGFMATLQLGLVLGGVFALFYLLF